MTEPNEPPPLSDTEKTEPPLGFGVQVCMGIIAIILLLVVAYVSRSGPILRAYIMFVPPVAIGCCFSRNVRGFGVGLLLGYGLAALATLGICAASMKVI